MVHSTELCVLSRKQAQIVNQSLQRTPDPYHMIGMAQGRAYQAVNVPMVCAKWLPSHSGEVVASFPGP